MTSQRTASTFRKYHRLLGFFLAGIMAIYALSGSLLIFRGTDFLKYEQTMERQLAPNMPAGAIGGALKIREFTIEAETPATIRFAQGSYDKASGVATVTMADYPPVLQKLVKMHKATNNSPLFFMNLFFGAALLFFSVSAFFMFMPKLPAYRSGLKVAAAGAVMAVLVVLFS